MATIREISDRAGVSIATVSKVLNNKSGVKQETADRILQIADQLNYRPNLNARSLKLGDARTIGIITEDLTVFNTPEIVDGVASVCETLNYHYILSNLRFNKRYHDNPWDYPESNVLVRSAVNDLLSKQVAASSISLSQPPCRIAEGACPYPVRVRLLHLRGSGRALRRL